MAHAKLAALAVLVVMILHVSTRSVAARLSRSELHEMPAVMTMNGFGAEVPSECDGKYHSGREILAALSTKWYAGGRRCERMIRITSKKNGRTVEACVVDECDTTHGCKENVVDTSPAMWKALGLDTNIAEVPVTWSDA